MNKYNYKTDYNSKEYPVGKVFQGSNDTFTILGRTVNNPDEYVVLSTDGSVLRTYSSSILRNSVYNPNKPSVFGWGIIGNESTSHKGFNTWKGMVRRCYWDNKEFRSRNKSYNNVIICNEWQKFSNYKAWFEKNYIEGYVVDKDILCVDREIKIYSPSTCLFIPESINRLIVTRNNISKSNLPLGISKSGNGYRTSVRDFETGKRKQISGKNIQALHLTYLKGKQLYIEKLLNTSECNNLDHIARNAILGYYKTQITKILEEENNIG
jgi:hypothetical protein